MKETLEEIAVSEKKRKSGLKGFLEKLRHGPLKCLFCREVVNGMGEMWAHLRDHCR